MKLYRLFKILILSFFLILAGTNMVWAEGIIQVSHSLTGYILNDGSVTLNFVLHVENIGETAVYDLVLSNVPIPIITEGEISLNIGTIDARTGRDISFRLVTPMLLTEQEFREQPLFWAGKFIDGNGNLIEFPAVSHLRIM